MVSKAREPDDMEILLQSKGITEAQTRVMTFLSERTGIPVVVMVKSIPEYTQKVGDAIIETLKGLDL